MAFALRVKSAKRKISECPYVKQTDDESVGQESVVTMENNYKRVSRELEDEVKHVDLKDALKPLAQIRERKRWRHYKAQNDE